MTSAVLPLHRARWSTPRSDRFSEEKPEFKVSKGTHHLLVALNLRLAHRNGFLTALLALCVVCLAAATVLVAFQAGHIGGSLIRQSSAVLEPHRVLLATHNRLAWWVGWLADAAQERQRLRTNTAPGNTVFAVKLYSKPLSIGLKDSMSCQPTRSAQHCVKPSSDWQKAQPGRSPSTLQAMCMLWW